jgi:predicted PurR-regulated permease PerM
LKILSVFAVFIITQAIEGGFLTPKLIGEKVGLHPVWVLFAIFAGAAMMGFLGVLIAVPVAAVVAVLGRYGLERYLKSCYYSK